MKLLTEQSYLTENYIDPKSKTHYIQGIFMQTDVKNRNKRIYPLRIVEPEVNRYIVEFVNQNRAVGELTHPSSIQINLDRVSHLITELKKEGTNFIGKAKITKGTPCGAIAVGLLEAGVRLGVSTRGVGSVENKGDIAYVKDDFHMATIDIVADPSAPDAFVQSLMEEVEWVWENGILKEKDLEQAKKRIHMASSRKLMQEKLDIFQKFLGSL